MKVKLTPRAKEVITLAEVPTVRKLIRQMQEDSSTVEDYAKQAVNIAYDNAAYSVEILTASAEIAKNECIWDTYYDGSRSFDIWIEAKAFVNSEEFCIIGAHLSDIWSITADNQEEIFSRMYVKYFKEGI